MAHTSLTIRVDLDRLRTRGWHARAIQALSDNGHRVCVRTITGRPLPPSVALLSMLEGMVYRRSAGDYGDAWSPPESDGGGGVPDLVVDLSGAGGPLGDVRTLRVLYAGSILEEAAYADLFAGRPPTLGISDSRAPNRPRQYRIAIEDPFKVSAAMTFIGARFFRFLLEAVSDIAQGGLVESGETPSPPPLTQWSTQHGLAAFADRARAALNRLSRTSPHWYVGWRRTAADAVQETLAIPRGGWTPLADDGQRFYADPMAVHHQGRDWMFVEEFPYATQKGILSVVEMGPQGPIGTPKPVLELAHHLSYPFVFEDGGQMWMIPESYSAKRVELYRAVDFPWCWVLDRVLISGDEVSDATLVRHRGRLWLFGTLSGDWQSSWDTLKIWSADVLAGPWSPCGEGTTLVDARCARPAGAFFNRGGELWRPAQDCTTGYGAGLALARVDRLDTDSFSQTVATVLRPNDDWPGVGLHTLTAANGIEAVDGCRMMRAARPSSK